jgi:hypothetical protein
VFVQEQLVGFNLCDVFPYGVQDVGEHSGPVA